MAEREAIEQGRRQAAQVMEDRRRRRALRRDAIERRAALGPPAPATAELAAEPVISAALRAELGPPGSQVLIAEGDSWFDYPFTDVLKELEDHGETTSCTPPSRASRRSPTSS